MFGQSQLQYRSLTRASDCPGQRSFHGVYLEPLSHPINTSLSTSLDLDQRSLGSMLYLQRKAAEYTRDGAPFVRAGQYILIYTTHFIFHKFILMFRTQLTTSYPLIPSLLVSTWNLLSFSINAREWRKVGCHDVLFGILAPKSYKFYSWALAFCLSVATS